MGKEVGFTMIYDDYKEIDFTSTETSYWIGDESGSRFRAEEFLILADQDCKIRFDHSDALQHNIRASIWYRFERKTARLYVIRDTVDGTLKLHSFGDDVKGKFEVVKNCLNNYVYAAVGGTVSNNWKIGIKDLSTFPISTLRFGNVQIIDENYGGLVPEAGSWAIYEFSIFVHEKAVSTYLGTTPKFYEAMDAADDIIDYLIGKSENEDEKTVCGIYEIYDLFLDGVQPDRRAKNVGRLVVSGRIRAKWLDP